MATAQPKYDPSMDELLASIRRIISEDDRPAEHVQAQAPDYGFSEAFEQEMAPQDDFPGLDPAMLPDLIEQSIREAFPGGDSHASGEPAGGWAVTDMEAFSAALVADELGYDELGYADAGYADPNDHWRADQAHAGESLAPDAEEIRRLLSDRSEETVGSSFDALARSVDAPAGRGLEDVVQDCLRPMLRAWLDQNLPPIVERMVQQEIARVSRRR